MEILHIGQKIELGLWQASESDTQPSAVAQKQEWAQSLSRSQEAGRLGKMVEPWPSGEGGQGHSPAPDQAGNRNKTAPLPTPARVGPAEAQGEHGGP